MFRLFQKVDTWINKEEETDHQAKERLDNATQVEIYKYIYSACLFVFNLYPINVKTAEQIRLKFFVEPHITLRKVYEC